MNSREKQHLPPPLPPPNATPSSILPHRKDELSQFSREPSRETMFPAPTIPALTPLPHLPPPLISHGGPRTEETKERKENREKKMTPSVHMLRCTHRGERMK